MLKIAFMTRWNAACGTSLLGELIGRELMRRGYALSILAPFNDDKLVTESDEEEVKRCYSIYRFGWRVVEKELDPEPFFNLDYDIFMAQGFGFITCMEQFRGIYPQIREKARTVYIVHERKPASASFAELDWDALVCFDERYKKAVSRVFGEEKCEIIPYPYYPVVKGDMREARERLNLPQDRRIILSFGWRLKDYIPLLPIIEEVNQEFPLKYVIVADPRAAAKADEIDKDFVELRYEVPPTEKLYTYLHASDCLLLHKKDVGEGEFVVSSVVHMCLGSLTPIVTSATRYVEMLRDEVIKYSDFHELKDRLIGVFEDSHLVTKTIEAAERRVREHSAAKITDEYVRLFHSLLARGG